MHFSVPPVANFSFPSFVLFSFGFFLLSVTGFSDRLPLPFPVESVCYVGGGSP